MARPVPWLMSERVTLNAMKVSNNAVWIQFSLEQHQVFYRSNVLFLPQELRYQYILQGS